MNSNTYVRGDILKATDQRLNKGFHRIIYLSPNSASDFIGAMVTHGAVGDNILMDISHFVQSNQGTSYEFQFDDTYLVQAKLLKFENWGPFTKVGQLSDEGIIFVNSIISKLRSETFRNYNKRTKRT